MKIKGWTNGSPFELEENIAAAISRLCDVFTGYNPELEYENDKITATNATQAVLFRGSSEEMVCLKEAAMLIVLKRDKLSKSLAADSPSSFLVRREMDSLKMDIIASMTFRETCSRKSTLQEAYGKIAA